MSTTTALGLGLAGGSTFPADQLPGLVRHFITPWLPNYWYIEAMRALLVVDFPSAWALVTLKIALGGAALMVLAVYLLRRQLERGSRP